MEEVLEETLTSQRFSALLLGVFAVGGAGARVGRHLQRAVVHRARPQPRDRHPHGARRADRRRAAAGRDRRDEARRHRHLAGAVGALLASQLLEQAGVRRQRVGPVTLAAVARARHWRRRREPGARLPRRPPRSVEGAARGLTVAPRVRTCRCARTKTSAFDKFSGMYTRRQDLRQQDRTSRTGRDRDLWRR